MDHKVINKFIDKKDKNTVYEVGDEYPKGNHKPSKKRIEELSKQHPTYKCAFIEKIKEGKKASEKG